MPRRRGKNKKRTHLYSGDSAHCGTDGYECTRPKSTNPAQKKIAGSRPTELKDE